MRNHKGFTLVELLVSLGLSVIIITMIMSFFISNYKNYKYINNNTELQFQAQYILNFMTNKILESKYIEQARNNTISHLKKSGQQKITKVSFRYGTESTKCYNFENRNNKIYYGDGLASSSVNVELGNYVIEMFICPVPAEIIFENAKAVKISLFLENENQSYESEQTIFMRNN